MKNSSIGSAIIKTECIIIGAFKYSASTYLLCWYSKMSCCWIFCQFNFLWACQHKWVEKNRFQPLKRSSQSQPCVYTLGKHYCKFISVTPELNVFNVFQKRKEAKVTALFSRETVFIFFFWLHKPSSLTSFSQTAWGSVAFLTVYQCTLNDVVQNDVLKE